MQAPKFMFFVSVFYITCVYMCMCFRLLLCCCYGGGCGGVGDVSACTCVRMCFFFSFLSVCVSMRSCVRACACVHISLS